VIERQLAHKEQNEIRAAYHRSTYMQDREKPDAVVGGLPGRPQGGQRGQDAPAGGVIQPRMALPPPCYRWKTVVTRGQNDAKPSNHAACRAMRQRGQRGNSMGNKVGALLHDENSFNHSYPARSRPPSLPGLCLGSLARIWKRARRGLPLEPFTGPIFKWVSPRFVPGAAVQTCAPIQRDRCIVCPVDNFCPFVC
jgi:hypothetical protein